MYAQLVVFVSKMHAAVVGSAVCAPVAAVDAAVVAASDVGMQLDRTIELLRLGALFGVEARDARLYDGLGIDPTASTVVVYAVGRVVEGRHASSYVFLDADAVRAGGGGRAGER